MTGGFGIAGAQLIGDHTTDRELRVQARQLFDNCLASITLTGNTEFKPQMALSLALQVVIKAGNADPDPVPIQQVFMAIGTAVGVVIAKLPPPYQAAATDTISASITATLQLIAAEANRPPASEMN